MSDRTTVAAGSWRPIETAPDNMPVEVWAGRMAFPAILRADASLDSDEMPCDQWQATTDRHPKCWSDGACWESNADERASRMPTHWRHLTEQPK